MSSETLVNSEIQAQRTISVQPARLRGPAGSMDVRVSFTACEDSDIEVLERAASLLRLVIRL